MKKFCFAVFVLFGFLSVEVNFANTPEWIQYTDGKSINCLCIKDNYLYIGAVNGILKRNLTNGDEENFNNSNSGLPSNKINAIQFDNFGNLWAGTLSGLAKFDGTSWTKFTTLNSGIPANNVNAIAIEPNGNIWVATFNGIGIFDGTNWTVLNQSNSQLPDNEISAISIDNYGTKWIGFYNGNLIKIKGENWKVYNSSNSPLVSNNSIRSIAIEDTNTVWLGAGKLAVKYQIETWESFDMGFYIYNISIDKTGNKWVGFYDTFDPMGVCIGMYNNTTWKFFTRYMYQEIPGNKITSFAVDKNNNVYIGSNGGLAVYNNGLIQKVNMNTTINTNNINSIYIDKSNVKWICTNSGLTKFDGSSWTNYTPSNSKLPSNYVSSVIVDNNNKVWIATFNGLVCISNNEWTIYNTSNCNIPSNRILCLAIDQQGIIWIGSENGLTKYNGNTWISYVPSNSQIPGFSVKKLLIDNNIKWIATGSGLATLDGSTWTIYYTYEDGADFTDIQTDNLGNKWAASSLGLHKYDGTSWQIFDQSNSGIPYFYASAVEIDSQGNKWVGTGNGLAKFDDTNWTVYKTNNSGLTYNDIRDLTVDSYGNLWISTSDFSENWGGISVYKEGGVVEVKEDNININVTNFFLSQNYPNPFNPSTTINYQIPNESLVTIKVYDILGKEVTTLVNENKAAGKYSINFDAKNLASGVYLYRIKAGNYVSTKKMMLLR